MLKTALTKVFLPILGLGVLATACTPNETPTADAPGEPMDTVAVATVVVLPDGTECLNAGDGATLAFDGERLSYTCGDDRGLLGDVVITDGMEATLNVATLDGTTITDSETLALTVNAVELTDGTVCLNAGQGATLAFDGQRLNFTCPEAAEETGLIGDIATEDGVFTVEQAILDGTNLVSSEVTTIAVVETATP